MLPCSFTFQHFIKTFLKKTESGVSGLLLLLPYLDIGKWEYPSIRMYATTVHVVFRRQGYETIGPAKAFQVGRIGGVVRKHFHEITINRRKSSGLSRFHPFSLMEKEQTVHPIF